VRVNTFVRVKTFIMLGKISNSDFELSIHQRTLIFFFNIDNNNNSNNNVS